MITIGVQMGGPEQRESLVRKLLLAAMKSAEVNRLSNYNDGTEAWINTIYIVPGSVWRPDFYGCELGYFSKKKKGLLVKIAVPDTVVDGGGVAEFVGLSLREAVRIAHAHFVLKKIPFSVTKAEEIIRNIEFDIKNVS